MLYRIAALVLAVILSLTAQTTARAQTQQNHWSVCTLHLDFATEHTVINRQCFHIAMPRHRGKPAGHWKHCERRSPHIIQCVTYPTFVIRAPVRPVTGRMSLYTTYYCLTGLTASGRKAGPGIVASYLLPWGAHVRDTTTGWEGWVLDHPGSGTEADEWLPCPQAFPTGTHVWEVLS